MQLANEQRLEFKNLLVMNHQILLENCVKHLQRCWQFREVDLQLEERLRRRTGEIMCGLALLAGSDGSDQGAIALNPDFAHSLRNIINAIVAQEFKPRDGTKIGFILHQTLKFFVRKTYRDDLVLVTGFLELMNGLMAQLDALLSEPESVVLNHDLAINQN